MPEEQRSLLARVLIAISGACFRNPKLCLFLCAVLFAGSVALGFARLELRMDWTYLFEPDDPVVQDFQAAREVFPYPGDIAVLVDRGRTEEREKFLDDLAARLEKEPELFYHVFYRFPLAPLASKALYFLDEEILAQIATGLKSLNSGKLGGVEEGPGKEILLKLLSDLDLSLRSRGRSEYIPIWEFLAENQEGEIGEYIHRLMNDDPYVYATLGGGKLHALVLMSGTRGEPLAPQDACVKRIRQILHEMTPTVDNLRIRLTGLPVMLNDERETCTQDSIRSGVISMVLILMIFSVGFGEVSRPVLAITALTCGLGWTIGYTTLAVGHLNFITVSLVTMLMGLGIDFGIHILFRYDEELSNGRECREAVEHTVGGTGVDTFVGATATAAAFLALTQANFRGISDFGVIAAGGVMLCFLSTITVLPALLALTPGKKRKPNESDSMLQWLEENLLGSARTVAAIGAVIILLSVNWAMEVGFSYNLLEVQAPEISSVQTEIEMIQDLKTTVLSAECNVEGREKARQLVDAFEALPSVSKVGSLLPLLPHPDARKQEIIETITREIQKVEMPRRIDLDSARDLLAVEQRVKEFEKAFPSGTSDPEVERAIEALRNDVRTMAPGPIQDGLKIFQEHVRGDLAHTLSFLKSQQAVPPGLEDIPDGLKVRYVSPDGVYKITIQPTRNIWEKENLEEFLDETKRVEKNLLGHPVVQEHILGAFNRAFERTPWFTLFGVLMVMLVYLRRPTAVFLSLLPTATGVLVIFATMGFAQIDFNVVNFVALPMSVGIGAVYGVHALHRMRELKDETLLSSSTGPALLLSGVTTMVGFASLMTAHHRGLSSLGFVISVGVAANFIVSLVYLPALRRVVRERTLSRAHARRHRANQARRARREAERRNG